MDSSQKVAELSSSSQKAMESPDTTVVKRGPSALPSKVLDRVLKSTRAVRKPVTGYADDNTLGRTVQAMWERADEMMFEERGDRDMTKHEVAEHLSKQPNPFDPLPEDHDERLAEAIERGDLEALQKMENVYVYQTYRDQKKDQQGEDYDDAALEEGQIAMTAKAIWNHFDELHKLRTQISGKNEWDALLATPKWSKFIRWYPTIAGMAANPAIPEHEIDSLRQMLEQKHMRETDSSYTQEMANAAFDEYSHGEYLRVCKKIHDQKLAQKK
jgi:hypothetical protein